MSRGSGDTRISRACSASCRCGARKTSAAVADKGTGFLVSKNPYTDFQLRVEFWGDDDVNSGIYMRCSNPSEPTDKTCYEANIYDKRPDPRAEDHPPTGSTSTSEPHPSQDPEAEPWEGPKRDKLDD